MGFVHIDLTQFDDVIRNIPDSDAIVQALIRATNASLLGIQADAVVKIPAPPAGTTYRRGQDARSEKLTSQITSTTDFVDLATAQGLLVTGRIGANASYAPFVIGESQAAVHVGRWFVLYEEAQDHRAQIIREYEYELRQLLGG